MGLKKTINPSDFEVGVIIGRFQTNKLHEGHINLISHVLSNHKKTIILLGVSRVQNTKKNPLDFASRKAIDVIEWCIVNKPNIPDIGFTTPAMAMPDEFKVDSVVESYRNYYMGAKISLASWKNREKPFWFGKKELV